MADPVQVLAPAGHERQDVRFKYVVAGGAWMALLLALVLLGAWWLFPDTMTDQYVAQPLPGFAAPQLQASPPADMARFRQQQLQALNQAYWLDRGQGVVHLPIADAMRKVAQQGIADWPQ